MKGRQLRKGKKGFYFTLDAILASLILLSFFIFSSSLWLSQRTTPPRSSLLSFDILTSLDKIYVSDSSNALVQQLITDGNITRLHNTLLEQIIEFWAFGKRDLSRELFINVTYPFLEFDDFRLVIGDAVILDTIPDEHFSITGSSRILSGITENRSKFGYMARAIATKMAKNTTKIIKGDVIYSSVRRPRAGNNQNSVYITYYFDIPKNSTLYNAKWFVQAAYTDNWFQAFVNGQYIPGSAGSDPSGSKSFEGLESYLVEGRNTATLHFRFGGRGALGGDDGSSHFKIQYYSPEAGITSSFTDFNFAEVKSECPIRYKKPVYIMGDLNYLNLSIYSNVNTVSLSITFEGQDYFLEQKENIDGKVTWSNVELTSLLGTLGLDFSDLSNKYVYFNIDLDEFVEACVKDYERVLEPESKIYLRTDRTSLVYGKIDITREMNVKSYSDSHTGDFYRDITWNFSTSEATTPLLVDCQLAWLYFLGSSAEQAVYSNSDLLYSHPPQNFILEFARYAYTPYETDFLLGENIFRTKTTGSYAFNPFSSLCAYTFFIDNSVSYGDVFQTQAEAEEDAIERLNEVLGSYADALQIGKQVIGLGDVLSLWGPTKIELVIAK